MAQAALPEGSYDVTLSYAGDADILLPFTQGQLSVRGGQTTKVELAAASRMGRIVMQAESGRAAHPAALVSYASEETGEGRLRPVCDGRGRAGGFRPASGGRLPRGGNHRTEKHPARRNE